METDCFERSRQNATKEELKRNKEKIFGKKRVEKKE